MKLLLIDIIVLHKAYIQKYADFDKKDAFMDKVSIKKGDADGRD